MQEWMLYDEKVLSCKPVTGTSALDSDPDEVARHSSVFSHFARVPHREYLLELTDTPWGDFPSDALASLDGADSAVTVVSAEDGVQAGTLEAFKHCRANNIKMLIALSKLDKPSVDLDAVMADLGAALGAQPLPMQVPIREGFTFKGLDPLLVLDSSGKLKKNEMPKKLGSDFEKGWARVEEAVATCDDELLVGFLDGKPLDPADVVRVLKVMARCCRVAEQCLGFPSVSCLWIDFESFRPSTLVCMTGNGPFLVASYMLARTFRFSCGAASYASL